MVNQTELDLASINTVLGAGVECIITHAFRVVLVVLLRR